MESFKENRSKESVLDLEDVYLLEYALHSFKKYLFKMDDGNLPDHILLPETSTRPILYAIKPIIEKVYSGKGRNLPSYSFVNISRENSNEKDEQKDFLVERIEEITNRYKEGNYLIVDDFGHSGSTVTKIETLLKNNLPNLKVNHFVLAWLNGEGDNVGINTHDNRIIPSYSDLLYKDQFSYAPRYRGLWNPTSVKHSKTSVIGVDKEKEPKGKYVNLADDGDSELMRSLREEMGALGEKVANGNFDYNNWREKQPKGKDFLG